MEWLNSAEDIDSYVTKNPNAVVVIYEEGCPWCEKMKKDLENLEEKGLAKVYLLPAEKGAGLAKKLGANGFPVTISFKECEVSHIFDGYDESIAETLMKEFEDARPVCRVNLSEVLFKETLLGEPLI